jgi:pyruvate formate lyase activating enzyme
MMNAALKMKSSEKALIFDIQGHSVHDGPGTRTLIFFSGCPLRCRWCANPEGLSMRVRRMVKTRFCKSCPRRCIEACPHQAIRPNEGTGPLVVFDRPKCLACSTRDCVSVCYTGALQRSGRWHSVDELMKVVRRDSNYWGPKGGITISGGEPLAQIAFVKEFLRNCHESYISVCVETSAQVPRSSIEAVMPYVQWFFIDVKHMNPETHRAGTGVGNENILANIEWIAKSDWKGRLLLRMPVIPGFNNSIENARDTASFMQLCGLNEINLLPFHRLGASKHEQLGAEYPYNDQPALKPSDLVPLASVYREQGLKCYLGSDTPW